jgi:hypothetical protein
MSKRPDEHGVAKPSAADPRDRAEARLAQECREKSPQFSPRKLG